MSNNFSDMFRQAALVVAHPDDEALWFSSILEKVDEIVICYMEMVSRPDWSEGRRRCSESYPFQKATFLALQESEVFNGADWLEPVPTHYGLEVSKKNNSFPGFSAKRYRKNYEEIREQLSMRLRSRRNVFTHNPWGDYGHEDHVQVFRAIQDLQHEFGFNLWCSNYCSSKSYHLMLRYVYGFDSSYMTVETDRELGKSLMQLYQRNHCWTWYDDYEWFTHECFMLFNRVEVSASSPGHIFPLNFIKVGVSRDREDGLESMPFARKMARRLRRLTE